MGASAAWDGTINVEEYVSYFGFGTGTEVGRLQVKNFVDSSEWEIKETMRRGYWTLSYRGRKRLRYVLYEVTISLTGKRAEFREIHEYYRSRKENPLKKMRKLKCMPWLWKEGRRS